MPVRPTTCARAGCLNVLPPPAPVGRPRTTCSEACKKALYRQRSTELAQRARALEARKAARRSEGYRSAWWTPADLRAQIWDDYGPLGLDAAACSESTLVPENWLGPTHEDSARRDALAYEHWADLTPASTTVYLNPPYQPAKTIASFLATAARTAKEGVHVVALVPAATSTRWWHQEVFGHPTDVCFLPGRVRYVGPHDTGGTPLWGSALVLYK